MNECYFGNNFELIYKTIVILFGLGLVGLVLTIAWLIKAIVGEFKKINRGGGVKILE